ncbi:MAG: PhoH family protein, partial [Actinomycetota bacterium]|nr:PhoH family protein [Actinomycetota bacterium]
MGDVPAETVTYLFTDIVGSTALWELAPGPMAEAMARHDELVSAAVACFGGDLVRSRGEGDSRFAVFSEAAQALGAAAQLMRALGREPWPTPYPLGIRAAVHTGTRSSGEASHYGTTVNRTACLRAAAHPNQVLVSGEAAAAEPTLPPGIGLRHLGAHRLSDLGEAEQVYQLLGSGLEETFPPLLSLDRARHNLPHQVSSFVGRQMEQAELAKAFEGSRLVTVTGPGGTGKTRLALQAAAAATDHYPDGLWFVELTAAVDEPSVVDAVARAVGVPVAPGRPAVEALVDFLRAKTVLLVLDNCEHVVAAAGALVARLLRAAPGLRVLATSRQSLGLPGEHLLVLCPLDHPDRVHMPQLEELQTYDSIVLFTERARAAQSGFRLDGANAEAVATICAQLDGIPLAIELAAARLSSLSLPELAEGVDRLRLVAPGPGERTGDHQTLRATLDWSWALLDPDEAAVARRLSAFAGGFCLEAAEAVADTRDLERWVGDLLTDLVDKSLVVAGHPWSARYRMLETVRAYAMEKLQAAGEEVQIRDRHLAWCVGLGAKVGPRYRQHDGDVSDECLDTEIDNMRTALGWGLDRHRVAGFRLAADLSTFWWSRGYTGEAIRILGTYLEAFPDAAPALRGHADATAGWLHYLAGNHKAAQFHLAAAIQLAEEHGLTAWWVAWSLGEQALLLGGEEGRALALRGRELAIGSDDPETASKCCNNLARLSMRAGDLENATRWLEEALEHVAPLGRVPGRTRALWSLAQVSWQRGDASAAGRLWSEVLDVAEEMHDLTAVSSASVGLGDIALADGDVDSAEFHFEKAVKIARDAGLVNEPQRAIVGLGRVHQHRRDFGRARDLIDALVADLRARSHPELARTLLELGRVATLQGDHAAGAQAIGEAVAVVRQRGSVCWDCLSRSALWMVSDTNGLSHPMPELLALLLQNVEIGSSAILARAIECVARVAAGRRPA